MLNYSQGACVLPYSVQGTVSGRVQGVGFRFFVQDKVFSIGDVTGWVCNLEDGRVSYYAEGPKESLEKLIEAIRTGPPFSRVDEVTLHWSTISDRKFSDFDITDGEI
jgi:acylphosphatase